MSRHDFTPLYDRYPAIIDEMPPVFTSHQFILRLAQRHQVEYIEALYQYRDSLHRGAAAPFMTVHARLAQRLSAHPELVALMGDVPSMDIFGQSTACAQWRRL